MFKLRVLAGRAVIGGDVYSKDQIFESPWDLRKNYANKFELVHEDSQTAHMPVSALAPVSESAPTPKAPQTVASEAVEAPAKPVPPKPSGTDVTERFPKAVEQDFKVYKRQGQYYVYDADDLAEPLNTDGVTKAEVDSIISKAL